MYTHGVITPMKEIIQVHSREQLLKHAHVTAQGDVVLRPNQVYILNTPISVKALHLCGDTEIRGTRNKRASLHLTKAGAGISGHHLDKLILRQLKLSSGAKTSLFDLTGKIARVHECSFNAPNMGRVHLQSLGMHDIKVDRMLNGFLVRSINDLTMKFMSIRNSSGALLDLSTASIGETIKLKRMSVGESMKDHFELLRMETRIGDKVYRPLFLSEEDKVIHIEESQLAVKSINSYRTILEARDKLTTAFKYTDQDSLDGYILQPCKELRRRVSLMNVSVLTP